MAFGLGDLPVAILVHREEIPIGELAGGVVAQELAFLLPGQVDLLAEDFDLSGGILAIAQGLVHLNILIHQCFGVCLRLAEYLEEQRL